MRASIEFYFYFTLPMDRSPGFGSMSCNCGPVQTRFRYGSTPSVLNLAASHNSLARSTKSTWSLALPLLVNIGFQVLFHSPPGVLFTVPSRYCALSVIREYLALGGGPPCFPQGFSCLVVLWCSAMALHLHVRDFHPLR